MGALIGSLYAFDPGGDTTEAFRSLSGKYVEVSKSETTGNMADGAVVGAVIFGVLTGGIGGLALGAALGAGAGKGVTDKVDLDRLRRVLDDYFSAAQVESLPLAYRTFHQRRVGDGLVLVPVKSGNLAEAVMKSVANPFIFEGFDVKERGYVDPGADRVAATPIEDTCRLFPRSRLIAINVTGRAAVYDRHLGCQVVEVRVEVPALDAEDVFMMREAFTTARVAGFNATRSTLEASRIRN